MFVDQSFSHLVMILLTLTTFSLDYVWILLGENWLWSLLGLKGLIVLCIKTTRKSPLGVSLSLSHTHIGLPWGFNLNFPTSIPVTFIWGYPGVLINSHINFVFLYFLKGPAPIMGTFLASLARPWRPEGVHLRELPLHKLYYYWNYYWKRNSTLFAKALRFTH